MNFKVSGGPKSEQKSIKNLCKNDVTEEKNKEKQQIDQ